MKIIFVYNADSDLFNSLFDFGHKIMSPETYQCNLCSLTHGNFSESKEWKKFRESSKFEMEFLHRDEFERKYSTKIQYPAVLGLERKLEIKISSSELNKFKSLNELISAVNKIAVKDNIEAV